MVMKKYIDGKRYDVYDQSNAPTNPDGIDNNSAMLIDDVVLPFRRVTETAPGLYNTGMIMPNGMPVMIKKMPTEEEAEAYSTKTGFVDFGDIKSIRDYMEKVDEERKLTEAYVSNVENVYIPTIQENDSLFMKGFKKAIALKSMDIYSYRDKFGTNFNNDKRSMESSSITLKKWEDIAPNLYMKMTITFDNADPNVPNPMARPVTVEINNPEYDFREAMAEQDRQYGVTQREDKYNVDEEEMDY